MTGHIKIIDLENDLIPELGNKKDTFRSKQVFRCPVCTSLTNNIEIRGGFKGWRASPFPICPHREQEWHVLLRVKIRLSDPAHPVSYRKELEVEIDSLRLNAKDDISGSADLSCERKFPATKLIIEDRGYD
ncbi:MAG: hypothetical protein ABIT47_00755 [Candidatus Paceibacterota bacterium]